MEQIKDDVVIPTKYVCSRPTVAIHVDLIHVLFPFFVEIDNPVDGKYSGYNT